MRASCGFSRRKHESPSIPRIPSRFVWTSTLVFLGSELPSSRKQFAQPRRGVERHEAGHTSNRRLRGDVLKYAGRRRLTFVIVSVTKLGRVISVVRASVAFHPVYCASPEVMSPRIGNEIYIVLPEYNPLSLHPAPSRPFAGR